MISILRRRRIVLTSLLGAVVGFLVLHPYTMVVYGFYDYPEALEGLSGNGSVYREIVHSFEPKMLRMGFPFAVLGAIAGALFGVWLDARKQRHELEKRSLALVTLRKLMMTLAHHLLNTAQIVGGFASRDIKKEQDEVIKRHLEAIRIEAIRIEAVVETLRSLESVESERLSTYNGDAMIDIQKELQERIEELKRKQT